MVDMGFKRMFSDPHCKYTESTDGSAFKKTAELFIVDYSCGLFFYKEIWSSKLI